MTHPITILDRYRNKELLDQGFVCSGIDPLYNGEAHTNKSIRRKQYRYKNKARTLGFLHNEGLC